MRRHNADIPKESRIEFRVGINVGDVIVEDDDLHGDGVNVAARLEGLSGPGEVFVSGTVYDQAAGKLGARFEDLGERKLKNISRPVRVYRARHETQDKATTPAVEPTQSERPSIAVLAFTNMSGDQEQEYFSDGIAEDVITDLSKIARLFVIARNTSFTYKGQAVDVKRIADELGVRYILEGSVRRAADRVRITAQLIDGASGGHLWAERYDRVLEDIFAIQDEITRHIVEALRVELDLDERERLGAPTTTNIEAYDTALRARSLMLRFTPEATAEAARLYGHAIELDPDYITAITGLAGTQFNAYLSGWTDDPAATFERGCELAARGFELDPDDLQASWAWALARLWQQDLDGAIEAIDQAVRLGPNDAESHASRGYILSYAARPEEAIESLEKSMRLDPSYPGIWLHFLAHAHVVARRYEEAASVLRRRIRRDPETDISRVLLASCYGHLGRADEARAEWDEALRINPAYSVEQKGRQLPYKDPADWDRIVDGPPQSRPAAIRRRGERDPRHTVSASPESRYEERQTSGEHMIPRYSRPEMAAIWTPEAKFRIWFEIEAHAMDAQAELGVVPAAAAKAVWEKRRLSTSTRIDEIEAEVKHDVIAFLTNLAENVGPRPDSSIRE